MTLKTLITADAASVFLNTDEFAQTITMWPQNVSTNAVTITAVVMLDEEPWGSGYELDDQDGRDIERRGRLEMLSTITITANAQPTGVDVFLIGPTNEKWWAVRTEGRDAASGLQTVVIGRTEKVSTIKSRIGK